MPVVHVREVKGPDDEWVVRAAPTGVSIAWDLFPGAGFPLSPRIRRWLRRDRSWEVSVRRREDPFGDPVAITSVPTRAGVENELDRVADALRRGRPIREGIVDVATGPRPDGSP